MGAKLFYSRWMIHLLFICNIFSYELVFTLSTDFYSYSILCITLEDICHTTFIKYIFDSETIIVNLNIRSMLSDIHLFIL